MKITQKQVDGLKQLDRIEYKQAYYEMQRDFTLLGNWVASIYISLFILIFFLMMDIWSALRLGTHLITSITINKIVAILGCYNIFMLVLDAINVINWGKNLHKLNERYFGKKR